MSPTEDPVGASVDEVGRGPRRLAAVLVALLLVPGVIGFDLWPLTGWRLFSLANRAERTRWVVVAVDGAGAGQVVDLEALPLAYRTVEWPLSRLRTADAARRTAVCEALLAMVQVPYPGTVHLLLARDERTLTRVDGTWVERRAPLPYHRC